MSYQIEGRRHTITWNGITTAGAAGVDPIPPKFAAAVGTIQVSGTFGDATVALTASNDGVTFFPVNDPFGDEVSLTAAGMAEFSTGAKWLRPLISGGTGDDIDVIVVFWGA